MQPNLQNLCPNIRMDLLKCTHIYDVLVAEMRTHYKNLSPNISPFQAAEEQKRSEEWDQPILCHCSENFEAIVLQATFFWQFARGSLSYYYSVHPRKLTDWRTN